MKHIVLDLEMNNIKKGSPARRIVTNEIIEIGAVMLDEEYREVASFRTYVKPEYNDHIQSKITNLTGITTAMVENAPVFKVAYQMFVDWCLGIQEEVEIHAWSDSDYCQFTKEMTLKEIIPSDNEKGLFDQGWTDFQKLFDQHLGFNRQLSLANALQMAGIDFTGREHDALDDARNTAELLCAFSKKDVLDSTLQKIKDAMTPKSLECTMGSLFDFSALGLA